MAVVLAQIRWTHYVDDSYLLGWRVKDLARFARAFSAIGVVFTFPAEDRTVVFANTQSRM